MRLVVRFPCHPTTVSLLFLGCFGRGVGDTLRGGAGARGEGDEGLARQDTLTHVIKSRCNSGTESQEQLPLMAPPELMSLGSVSRSRPEVVTQHTSRRPRYQAAPSTPCYVPRAIKAAQSCVCGGGEARGGGGGRCPGDANALSRQHSS